MAHDRMRQARLRHQPFRGFVSALFSSKPYNDTTSGFEARALSSADRSLFDASVQFTQMLMLSTYVCWLTIASQ